MFDRRAITYKDFLRMYTYFPPKLHLPKKELTVDVIESENSVAKKILPGGFTTCYGIESSHFAGCEKRVIENHHSRT